MAFLDDFGSYWVVNFPRFVWERIIDFVAEDPTRLPRQRWSVCAKRQMALPHATRATAIARVPFVYLLIVSFCFPFGMNEFECETWPKTICKFHEITKRRYVDKSFCCDCGVELTWMTSEWVCEWQWNDNKMHSHVPAAPNHTDTIRLQQVAFVCT